MSEIAFIKNMVFREYPLAIFALVLCSLIGSFLVVIGVGTIISLLAGLLGGSEQLPLLLEQILQKVGSSSVDSLTILTFLFILLILQILLDGLKEYISVCIGVHLEKNIKKKMNNALLHADWIKFNSVDQSKYLQCMIVESSFARAALNDLGNMLAAALSVFALMLWIMFHSIEVFIVFVISSAICLVSIQVIMKKTRVVSEERLAIMKKMTSVITDTKELFKLLFAENILSKRLALSEKLIDGLAFAGRRQAFYSIFSKSYMLIVSALIMLSISYFHLAVQKGSGPDLIFNLLLLQRIGVFFQTFQGKRQAMIQKMPSYQACLDMVNAYPVVDEKLCAKEGKLLSFERLISLKDLSFKYPNSIANVSDICIDFPANGLFFIVGRSGSGKTTLADIILGLIDPDEGKIILDEQPVNSVGKEEWADIVSYVPQQPYLFKGTLRENLLLGNDDVDDETLNEALIKSQCASFVSSLPNGLDTIISSGGGSFSGGERHRLSLARAFLKQSKLLVLDEPSSALDDWTEKMVLKSIIELSKSRLVLVITHSIDMIKGQQNVVLMDKGKCLWQGSYEELVEQKFLGIKLDKNIKETM